MAENQERPTHPHIPVFRVWKNNQFVQTISLCGRLPISSSSSSTAKNKDQEAEMYEVFYMGTHRDCDIKLEDPYVSEFHLEIEYKPSSRSVTFKDISVLGTWIWGNRVVSGVKMKLNESDVLHLGPLSRSDYIFEWAPISSVYDVDNPFVHQFGASDTINKETEGMIDQYGNSFSHRNEQLQTLSDNMEDLKLLLADEDLGLSMQKSSLTTLSDDIMTIDQTLSDNIECLKLLLADEDLRSFMPKISPTAPLMPDDLHDSSSNKEEVEKSSSSGTHSDEYETSSGQLWQFQQENCNPQAHFPSAVSETVPQLESTNSSGMNSEKRSGLTVQTETNRSRENSTRVNMSSQEIVSPTVADHILQYALSLKQTRNDGQLVLLSEYVTLRIKAMAEGIISETAEEFRGSLVNPLSARFLYSDSSPIGPLCSSLDDAALKEKYYPSHSNKLPKSEEGAKGLKLILQFQED
ncbi:hypothetical protein Pfo_015316 [Paulownia fortunei]|nr:hypothetical protein Pfo_015316 [Paulownia fortunei]